MKVFKGFKYYQKTRNYSLNLFSMVLLLLADIFLAIILFSGLEAQTDQITTAREYFPFQYRQVFINASWVENNFIDKLTDRVLEKRIFREKKAHKKMHPVCEAFDRRIDLIRENSGLVEQFKRLKRFRSKYKNYDDYQTFKLNMAGPAYTQFQALAGSISAHPLVKEMSAFVFEKQKRDYVDDIKAYKRIYAFKRTAYGFIFLLPVIGVLWLWNTMANKKDHHLGVIISSHFIIVALIPVLLELARLVLEFFPKVLFKTIYDFLIQSNLISIWYYVLIVLMAAAISVFIWFLQNKVFTRQRYLRNRIQKSRCTRCGVKVSYEKPFCPNCGHPLLTACRFCSEPTIEGYSHCQNCGKPHTRRHESGEPA